VLAGLDAVTLEDIQRVAQDIILEDRLNLAAIGPFDDPDRFQKLLALSA
jgi:predicted Zn-dependent peptidase